MWDGGPIGIPFITVAGTQTKYPGDVSLRRRERSRTVRRTVDRADRRRQQLHRRPARDRDRHHQLHPLRAVQRVSAGVELERGLGRDLRSQVERAAAVDVDVGRRRRACRSCRALSPTTKCSSGEIKHAIRFTAPQTRREFVWPARHYASSLTGTQYPRMGERFRLKASFDISPYPADVQVILRAMKKYGIMLADNGSAWYISGQAGRALEQRQPAHARTAARLELRGCRCDRAAHRSQLGRGAQSGVTVAVSPSSASVRTGRSQTFTATVTGAPNTVTWSVNGTSPAETWSSALIDGNGQYSGADRRSESRDGHACAPPAPRRRPPRPARRSRFFRCRPSRRSARRLLPTGNFTLTVNGAGFTAGSVVSFDGSALPTTFVSASQLRATGNAPAAKRLGPDRRDHARRRSLDDVST